jgi:hypothetical protein
MKMNKYKWIIVIGIIFIGWGYDHILLQNKVNIADEMLMKADDVLKKGHAALTECIQTIKQISGLKL